VGCLAFRVHAIASLSLWHDRCSWVSLVPLHRTRGFTLIEMMIVVVIVGLLATLAVVGYRKMVETSHITEAQNMVQDIRVAQESYHSETQQYANISASITSYYPQAAPNGRTATGWGAACSGCTTDWSVLPLHVDGPVMFGYATIAGAANTSPSPASISYQGQTLSFPAPSLVDWFIVAAGCDLDANGTIGTHVYTTSWSNQVVVDQED